MSKQTAEKLRSKFQKETNITPVFANRGPYIQYINWLESYHSQKLQELEEIFGKKIVYYNELYQELTKKDNHSSAAMAWSKAQAIKEISQLITQHNDGRD